MPARRSIRSLALLPAALVLGLAGCAGIAAPGSEPTPTEEPLSGQAVVLAAASLTGTFDALAAEFEAEHPDVDVLISYGGSSALAEQLLGGAPAAIFAAASTATMQTVVDGGLTRDEPVVFARN